MNGLSKVFFLLLTTFLLATPLYDIPKELPIILVSFLMLGIVLFENTCICVQVADVFCILIIASICSNDRFWSIDMYSNVCIVCILWAYSKFKQDQYTLYMLMLMGVIYGLISFYNMTSLLPLSIQWVIDNSGIMGVSLSLIYPLILGEMLYLSRKRERYILLILLIIYVIVILFTQSRSAYVAIVLSSLFLLYQKGKMKNALIFLCKRKGICSIFFLLIIGLVYCLLMYRIDSVKGRILIYKVTTNMILDNPLWGSGCNTFAANYLNSQYSFFKENPESDFSILADNTEVCLNEFLHIWSEFGLVGVLVIVALLIWLFRIRNENRLQISLKASLCALILASIFSYPLRRHESLLIVVVIIGNLLSFDECIFFKVKRKYSICLLLPLLIWFYVSFLYRISSPSQYLNTNVTDIYNHAVELSKSQQCEKANYYFQRALYYTNSYNIYLIMGRNCENMGQIELAKYYYERAHFMVPNRFLPLYRLMLLHQKEQSMEDAINYAHEIESKKVKIPSYTILKIKNDAIKLISDAEKEYF